MNLNTLVAVIALVASAGVSCASREAASPAVAETVQPETPAYERVTIGIERTACFGRCPVYTLSIDEDGHVEYVGRAFVQVEGRQTRQISPQQVRELVALFYEVDFFSMESRYDQLDGPGGVKMTVTDLPTTITTISLDQRRKRVENYVGGPESLRRLEDAIDRISGADEWIRETEADR